MKRYVSDLNRIMALIYEDQPLPPPVPKEASFPRPEVSFSDNRFYEERRAQGERRRAERKRALYAEPVKRQAPSAPKLQINFNALEKIRHDAEDTMNKLITEEEQDGAFLFGEAPLSDAAERAEAAAEAGAYAEEMQPAFGLSAPEHRILLALLSGGDLSNADTEGQLLSVLIDQINEKLFDEFADTVLENSRSPQVVPDYEDDLKAMFGVRGDGAL